MKWLISALLLLGCGGWGYVFAGELGKRARLLGELRASFRTLQKRIEYFADPLETALGQSIPLLDRHSGILFSAISEQIRRGYDAGESMEAILSAIVEKDPDFGCLVQKDRSALLSFAQKLGMDSATQRSAFDFIDGYFNEETALAQQRFASHARLYRASGLLTGLLLVILFW